MKFEIVGTGGNCEAYVAQYKQYEVLITHEYGPDLPVDDEPYRISFYRKNRALSDDDPFKTLHLKKFKNDTKLVERIKSNINRKLKSK